MKSRRPTHAVVTLAMLDLRRRPDHRSELGSQLLLGEVVRVIGGRAGDPWWRVENLADSYRGWARTWGLAGASAARAARWARLARARVVRAHVEAVAAPGSGTLVSPLYLNSRVIAGRTRGRFRRVELPDGRRGWVPPGALATGRRASMALLARVRGLLGVPYLWGGRTPLGFDCSGFTQQVLLEQGLRLPRDAGEQFRNSDPIPEGDAARMGDLVFFGPSRRGVAHVGLVLGGGYFGHARGRVRLSSMNRLNPLYDKEIVQQFLAFRRPRPTPPGTASRGRRTGESA